MQIQIRTYIRNSLLVYPNFVLFFPVFFFIDKALGTTLAFWLIVLYAAVKLFYMPRLMYGWVRRIVTA